MMAPLTAHPSCVCVLSGDADGRLADRGTAALSLEALDGVRRRWRFGDVARLADFVPKVLAETPADDRPILLIPPRSSVAWEAAAATWPCQVRLVGGAAESVGRIAEDKIWVRRQLQGIGVPVPDDLVLSPGEIDFGMAQSTLDTPFVLQAPNGAGGQGTYLIEDAGGLAAALAQQPHVDRWLLSRFAGRTTINVAGVVHVDGVQLLPASVQTSGIAELGVGFGAYCGSDFAAPAQLSAEVLSQAYAQAEVVGKWLHGLGHLGLFGADIAVTGDSIAFLEINPRIQGSSWLLSKLQQAQGVSPCLQQHVRALLGQPVESTELPISTQAGSHLLVRWSGPAGVVLSVPDLTQVEGVTVTAMPAAGITVLPGAILARLEAGNSLATPDGRGLLPGTRAFLEAFQSGVKLIPLP
ncbi:MAG TPA: hypothetical protein DGG94_13495 [Micromonosporaceae bacterium]|nr:hypothetical protein [Micromonosporaceae bacterium]HCU50791.1 hypothetical protein [Micromonosporaceae bacterium]